MYEKLITMFPCFLYQKKIQEEDQEDQEDHTSEGIYHSQVPEMKTTQSQGNKMLNNF